MMRRHWSTIDMQTGKQLILSQASYNLACEWLSRTLRNEDYEIVRTEVTSSNMTVIWAEPTTITAPEDMYRPITGTTKIFWYDENRGYLLSD